MLGALYTVAQLIAAADQLLGMPGFLVQVAFEHNGSSQTDMFTVGQAQALVITFAGGPIPNRLIEIQADKNQLGGYPGLDSNGLIDPSQLPPDPGGGGGGGGGTVSVAPAVLEPGNLGAAYTLDFLNVLQEVWLVATLNADCTVRIANWVAGCRALLLITQDPAAGHALMLSDGTTADTVDTAPGPGAFTAIQVDCPDVATLYVTSLGGGGGGSDGGGPGAPDFPEVLSIAGRSGDVTLTVADVQGAAPLSSPALTDNPTAPTAAVGDADTSLATTAFVSALLTTALSTILARPASVGAPVVSGTPIVGSVLVASTGSWVFGPTGYAYQWYASTTLTLVGATSLGVSNGASTAMYTVQAGDAGSYLFCRVVASNGSGSSAAVVSGVVRAAGSTAVPTSLTPPLVSGLTRQGATLTADPGGWTGAPTGYTYQWYAVTRGYDTPVGTGSTYVLQAADVAAGLVVAVVAANPGGLSLPAFSAATATIAATGGAPTNLTAPTVSGSPVVGQTLTASPGSWSAAPSFLYQWFVNGAAISGAPSTAATFTVGGEQAGETLSVAVTASNANGSATATSAMTPAVTLPAGAPVATAAPAVLGNPQVGVALTVTGGAWSGSPQTPYAYQWKQWLAPDTAGNPIAGATGPSYTPVATDVGFQLYVEVAATNPAGTGYGYTTPTPIVVAAVAPAALLFDGQFTPTPPSAAWPTVAAVAGDAVVVSDPLGSGQQVLRLQVTEADRPFTGGQHPRADVSSTNMFTPGMDRYVCINPLIPTAVPLVTGGSSPFFQFWQLYGAPQAGAPPVSGSIVAVGGVNHFAWLRSRATGYDVAWLGPAVDGLWHSMIYHVRMATDTSGFVELWFDGVQQTLVGGVTRLAMATLVTSLNWDGSTPNFVDLQHYRAPGMTGWSTVTTYHGAVKVATTYAAAAPDIAPSGP